MELKKLSKYYTKAKRYFTFLAEFATFKRKSLQRAKRFPMRWADRFPCLKDRTASTDFDRHYVYHTAWAARQLALIKPSSHVDFSSSLYFCSIVSAFVPVKFYDYRPADLQLTGLTSEPADLLSLPLKSGSLQSLSCMHVVEHVGLGRYGDKLDPDGDLKAISELKRVLAPGGSLLFVVPIGKPKIMFNAHRIYAFDQIAQYFRDLELKAFALIPDNPAEGGLIEQATKEMADAQHYGCGCFWFKKA
jgi:SAM-dependent methyltransferase